MGMIISSRDAARAEGESEEGDDGRIGRVGEFGEEDDTLRPLSSFFSSPEVEIDMAGVSRVSARDVSSTFGSGRELD